MNLDTKKIGEIFDYLYNPTKILERADGAFVFGRWDPLVAKKASNLYHKNLANYLLFVGGIGKDSGILKDLNIPEANFQAALSNIFHYVPKEDIYTESNATNGGECCRFGIDVINKNNLTHKNLILVVHPTSLRRVDAMMKIISLEKKFDSKYQREGTEYIFNPNNRIDQEEAIAEILRLADWPEKGWCAPQSDLPENLIEYARSVKRAGDSK